MSAADVVRIRRQCEELERAVRRAARSVVSGDLDPDADIGRFPPVEDDDLESWRARKMQLFGLMRFYHGIQLVKGKVPAGADYIRLKAFMEHPEYCELTSGRTVACYPVTVWRLDRIALRGDILRRITELVYELERLEAPDRWATIYQLDRERLWQRAAQTFEATLPPTSKLELPIDPPFAARVVVHLWGWLDGSNRRQREHWRLRWLAVTCWRWLDWLKVPLSLGLPPAWLWAISAADEITIMRTHLAANDERIAAIPPLAQSGSVENWGWSGFAQAVAEARNATPETYIRDRTLVAILLDVAQSGARAAADKKKREADDRRSRREASTRRPRARSKR